MRKLLFVACLLASTAAFAQTAPAPATPGANAPQHEKKFEERKSKILERISQHIAEAQQHQSCVQAATTPEALKACKPPRPPGGKRGCGGEGGEMGGQMGGPAPAAH